MADGFCENVAIDEGVVNGIRTQLHFEGDSIITQKTFDAEPHLEYAKAARLATEGQSWGEGKLIGHIPDLFYVPISQIKDRKEREKAINLFFQQNPAFIMFDRYQK